MPDIRAHVREKLASHGVAGPREAEIVEELALDFEAQLGVAILDGADPEAAWLSLERQIDWKDLANELISIYGAEARAETYADPAGKVWSLVGHLFNQLRYSFRMLRKSPTFTLTAIATIALGIGANTAIFSALYGVFWAPTETPDSPRLSVLWTKRGEGTGYGVRGAFHVSPREYFEWTRLSQSFEAFGAVGQRQVTLNDNFDYPEHIQIQQYTPGLVSMLGGPMLMGRDFLPEEGIEGKHRVAVISHQFWQRRYKSDEKILGKQLRLDGVAHTIVGVLKPGWWDRRREPLVVSYSIPRTPPGLDNEMLTVIALRKPGVTPEQAQKEMDAIAKRVGEVHPSTAGWTVRVDPMRNNWLNDRTRSNLWLLMGTVSLLLLIACVNVANLLLARGASRLREIAVRVSLGATEGRVFRQFLAENLLLSVIGGILGIGLSWAMLKIFLALLPPYSVPPAIQIQINGGVLLFTLLTVLVTGLVFGSAPAWQVARQGLNETLKLGGRSGLSRGRHRLGQGLVIVEFALALTLLTVAGLVMGSYWKRTHLDLGVRTENVLTFRLPFQARKFKSSDEVNQYNRVLLEKLRSVPGVQSAAVVNGVPLANSGAIRVSVSKSQPVDLRQIPQVRFRMVSSGFFDTFGVRTVQGRSFDGQDHQNSMLVAMVNETFAKEYFGTKEAIGQEIAFWAGATPLRGRIVGIYHDIPNSEQNGWSTRPEVVIPIEQTKAPYTSIAVRSAIDLAQVQRGIAAALQDIDRELPMADVRSLKQVMYEQTAFERFEAALYGGFAALALILATVGLYGLMGFVVSQRVPEMALRMALGASRNTVIRSVLKDGLKLTLVGLLLGGGAAYYAAQLLQRTLYGAGDIDKVAFAAVALILMAAATLACFLPARRAASVDPMTSLRAE